MLLRSSAGWILQVRDNKDGIWTPGKTNHWGGAFEPEDSNDPLRAATRELLEETGLTATDCKFTPVAVQYIESTTIHGEPVNYKAHLYVVDVLGEKAVYVHEGETKRLIPFDADFYDPQYNLSATAIHFLNIATGFEDEA